MKQIDLSITQGAIFSEDERYRYSLWRVWSPAKPLLLFIGLNPSKASAIINDPTITRLMCRAQLCNFGGLLAGNLYALVSSNPDVLLGNNEAVGLETDDYLHKLIDMAGLVLCGWGSFPAAKQRASTVLKMILEPYCLGINNDGQPKHPLYVAYGRSIVRYAGQSAR